MKYRFLLSAIIILIVLGSCNVTPKQNSLKIGFTEFSFDYSVVYILKGILDQQPNLEVELYRLPDSTMFRQVASGELDIGISAWLPNTHGRHIEKYPYEIVRHSLIADSLALYMAVPDYVEIERIGDLRNVASLLKNTVLIPEGQNAIYPLASNILEDYGLNNFSLHETSWDNIMYFVEESIRENAVFAFIALRPHHSFKKFNLKILYDNRYALGDKEQAYIVVNHKMPQRMPIIADFLAQIRFSLDDIEHIMEMNQILGSEPYENALRWINNNAERINDWMMGY